jgi:hypothetical protein
MVLNNLSVGEFHPHDDGDQPLGGAEGRAERRVQLLPQPGEHGERREVREGSSRGA